MPLTLQHPGLYLVHPGEEAQVLLPGKDGLGLVQVPQRSPGRFRASRTSAMTRCQWPRVTLSAPSP
jgi:hypothetical protein